MIIHEPELKKKNGLLTCRYAINSDHSEGSLWYSVQEEFAHLCSPLADAALVALLIPAMFAREPIEVKGAVSQRLFDNLAGPVQDILKILIPTLEVVKIHADKLEPDSVGLANGVATGFSAGVDSFCVLADHFFSSCSSSKVTHLIYNNVGSHAEGGEQLFQTRFERLNTLAQQMGLPLLRINSNLDAFYGKELDFQQTHTMRNASVALFLQNGIVRFLYASAYHYRDMTIKKTDSMGHVDAALLPLLSTESIGLVSSGGKYTRIEKTIRIAKIPISHDHLDVCVSESNDGCVTNCSTCWKCQRTLATLEIGGELERYSASFDLEKFNSIKAYYYGTLIGSQRLFDKEIMAFAKARGFGFTPASYLVAANRKFRGCIRRSLERLRLYPDSRKSKGRL